MINLRRIPAAARSITLRRGLVLMVLTTVAYGFDYLFNLTAGRLLDPADFGILVALTGIGQILVVCSRIVQTVVTRYVSELVARPAESAQIPPFFRAAFARMAWVGALITGGLLLLSPWIARFLNIEQIAPVLAMMAATWLMATRPVIGGVLQGEQRFVSLGSLQVVQAVLRLGVGGWLMWSGWRALGGVLALPIASGLTLLVGAWILGDRFWRRESAESRTDWDIPEDLWRYAAVTGAGLGGYALLINLDAILVKSIFDPIAAGNFGAALTLGKIVLFFPIAVTLILFPKATQMREQGENPAIALYLALTVVAAVCGGVTCLYFLFPDLIVSLTVGNAYEISGRLLGLIGLSMTMVSLVNIWINYFLSIKTYGYTVFVWIGVVIQVALIMTVATELWHIPAIVASNGAWLVAVGAIYFQRVSVKELSG